MKKLGSYLVIGFVWFLTVLVVVLSSVFIFLAIALTFVANIMLKIGHAIKGNFKRYIDMLGNIMGLGKKNAQEG